MRARTVATDVALIAVFAALVAACTLVPAVPVGVGVPITLQTFGVALAGIVLGPRRGFLAVLLYLLVGFAGLPVFAQGNAGLGVLAKPSAGYLVSFPIAALVSGALASLVLRGNRRRRPGPPDQPVFASPQRPGRFLPLTLSLCAFAASVLVVHPAGIVGFMVNLHLPLDKAFLADVIYWPGDLVKSALAGIVAAVVHRTFPALLRRPVPATDLR